MVVEPRVTVLTAVRNGAPFLRETIDSVLAQTIADWELVIVDDASEDDTPAIVESFPDERIRLIRRQTSGGPYAAANEGLRHARGRYVARLDGDDIALPHRLEAQIAYLSSQPSIRACVSGWRYIDGNGTHGSTMQAFRVGVLPWALCVVSGFVHSTLFIERDAIDEIGGYVETPATADLAMLCALSRRRWLGTMDDAVVLYRTHSGQITSTEHDRSDRYTYVVRFLKEHLEAITAEPWTPEETNVLHATGRWRRVRLHDALHTLDRWEAGWRADPTLDDEDRAELTALTRQVRLRNARTSAEPSIDMARALLRIARR